MDTILVNYPQQLFNDALYSYEEAIAIDKNKKPFEYWKYCTWSITTSTMAMESYVTDYLRALKNEIGQSYWALYERESERFFNNSKGIFSKLKLVELVTDSIIMESKDADWLNIKSTIKLRNDLIHYREIEIFNQINDVNALNSITSCRNLIKKFLHTLDVEYTVYAKWIDKTKSETYDR